MKFELYTLLTKGNTEGLNRFITENLQNDKTGKFAITKTPVLFSLGKETGKLLVKEGVYPVETLEKWWMQSLASKQNLVLGLASGREIRLIIIGILHVFSKKQPSLTRSFIQKILNTIEDWETCDQLALRVIVNLALQNRDACFSSLRQWAKPDNKWIRRLAVATIPPYIRAKPEEAQFCLTFLEKFMEEKDRGVQKAIGWALREISKKNPSAVFEFLKKHATNANKDTARIIKEGMKKLPGEQQETLKDLLSHEN